MARAIDVNQTWDYSLKADKGKERPTVFVIGVLKKKDKMRFTQFSLSLDRKNMDVAACFKEFTEVFKVGVRKIRDLEYSDGFRDIEVIDDDVIESIDDNDIVEVSQEIMLRNFFTEEQRKNSEQQLSSR